MIPLPAVLFILAIHFIADFVLQSHNMAINKSKSFYWLSAYVGVYTTALYATTWILFPSVLAWAKWVSLNSFLHLCVDFITSKINARLWQRKQVHNFFVGVGADQFVHYACLLLTYSYLQ